MPAARGLFRRAISQSGGGLHTMSLEQAGRVRARLGEMLGVPATREGFTSLTFEQIVAAQAQLLPGSVELTTAEDPDPTGGLTSFLPVRDGELLSAQPVDALKQWASAGIDLMAGTNTQEMNLYYVPSGVVNAIDSDQKLVASIQGRHPQPEKLVAVYRARRPQAQPGELFSAIMTDWMFHLPTVRLVEARDGQPAHTYLYEFAWPSPACGGKLGACHGLELGFVFDTLDTPGLQGATGMVGDHPPRDLVRRLHHTWVTFATTGDPGWPTYSTEQRSVMHIDDTWEVLTDPDREERLAWEGAR
jgi:para-nitrobenzyl esterase